MTPEEKARCVIDDNLRQSGWIIQDLNRVNLSASLGVAVREFPTSTGEVDYALFVDERPVGVVEAKRSEAGQSITDVEVQSGRYAKSSFKWIKNDYEIRFVYEATDKLIRFTDYNDIKYRSRTVFSFHRPETLLEWIRQPDTLRNNMKHFPSLDVKGFRKCQINAINNLEKSFADNRPKALVQMATGAGKTFTAITASYRLLKYGNMKRILFLVDTKGLGEQAEREFFAYTPNDDPRSFSQIYGVRRLKSSYIPNDVQICISTIQRMYSILKEEELDESAEETPFAEYVTAESKAPKEVVYNEKYPPEFFDCIIVDECHRSIYNVWSQVLSYFDAFIVGLTATPDNRTFAFFNENIVSEYPREEAIVDGVNVGEDIFVIETKVSKSGAHLMKQLIEYRDRLSRAKRWKQMDEDINYVPSQLDRDIVNTSQIRTVIRTFKENLLGDFAELCSDMNIISTLPEYVKPKNVGLMFFCMEPDKFFPCTQIDIVQFPDGLGGDNIIENTFKGPIHQQLREALQFIKNSIVTKKIVKSADKAEADWVYNYPYAALEEALANAVYHRGYDIREPIEVRVEKDMIEIVSFPGPDRSVTQEGLKRYKVSNRRYRNRRIGEILKELHLTEGRNTGFGKILRALEENGSTKPEFETDEDHSYFISRLFVHEAFLKEEELEHNQKGAEKEPKRSQKKEPKKGAERKQWILQRLEENPEITQVKLMEEFDLSRKQIQKIIKDLREKGLVERQGSNRSGRWIVKK